MIKIVKIYLDDNNRLRLVDEEGKQYMIDREDFIDPPYYEVQDWDINYIKFDE